VICSSKDLSTLFISDLLKTSVLPEPKDWTTFALVIIRVKKNNYKKINNYLFLESFKPITGGGRVEVRVRWNLVKIFSAFIYLYIRWSQEVFHSFQVFCTYRSLIVWLYIVLGWKGFLLSKGVLKNHWMKMNVTTRLYIHRFLNQIAHCVSKQWLKWSVIEFSMVVDLDNNAEYTTSYHTIL